MAESVLGVGTIELVADARRLKAGIEDAKRSIRTLAEGQKDISKAASASIDRYIGRIQAQTAALGKSAREVELFKLAQRGASNEQINAADAALRFAETQKAVAAATAKSAGIDQTIAALKQQNAEFGKSQSVVDLYKLKLAGASSEQLKAAGAALRFGDAQRKAAEATEKSAGIDRLVHGFRQQNAEFGKSHRQIELYRLGLQGASKDQLKAADTALRVAENQAATATAVQSLQTAFVRLGVIAATALVGAAVAFDSLVKQAANFQDLSEKTGETAENLASLAVAAKVGGSSIDEVGGFIIRMNKSLTGSDDEFDKAGAAIIALGLDVEKFKALKPAQQLEALAKSLDKFAEGQGKSNVLEAIAKGGANLLPVLKELSGETGRQNILTSEQIRLADEYADKQARLRAQIGLHAQAIVAHMLPAYNDLQGAFLDVIKGMAGVKAGADDLNSSKGIQEFAESAAQWVAFAADAFLGLVTTVQAAGNQLGGSLAGMQQLFSGSPLQALKTFRDTAQQTSDILSRPISLQNALEGRIAQRKQSEAEAANFVGPLLGKGGPIRPTLNFQGARKKEPKGGDTARQDAAAQLALDLAQIKSVNDAQVDEFRRAESIMQAMRSASLVDDKDYFASKLGFITLNAQAEEAGLRESIKRREEEAKQIAARGGKEATKDLLDNKREIAKLDAQIAKVQADAVTKTKINSIEEKDAIKKVEQAYLDAKDAAAAYLATIDRRNAREIEGIGRGQRFRERNSGLGDIDDRFLAERRRLDAELRRGQITPEKFNQYLEVAQDTFNKEVAMYEARTTAIEAAQADWLNGATEALQNYIDETRNVAKQFEDAFTRAFRGIEDFTQDLFSGSIKSLKDLENAATKLVGSVFADLARIEIKQNITGPLAEFLKENGRLEGLGGLLGFKRPADIAGVAVPVTEQILAKSSIPGLGATGVDAAASGAAFSTAVTGAAAGFSTAIATASTTVGTTLSSAGTTLATQLATAATTAAGQITSAGIAFAARVGTAAATGGGSGDLFGELFAGFASGGFAAGGQVTGPGTGTSDSIPALLSNREFVVRAEKAMAPGALPFLKTANERGIEAAVRERIKPSNVIPFARGGIVKRPEHFPLPDGATGLRGEAGPEAIMPLRAGGVIVAGGGTLPLARDPAGNMAVELPKSVIAGFAPAGPRVDLADLPRKEFSAREFRMTESPYFNRGGHAAPLIPLLPQGDLIRLPSERGFLRVAELGPQRAHLVGDVVAPAVDLLVDAPVRGGVVARSHPGIVAATSAPAATGSSKIVIRYQSLPSHLPQSVALALTGNREKTPAAVTLPSPAASPVVRLAIESSKAADAARTLLAAPIVNLPSPKIVSIHGGAHESTERVERSVSAILRESMVSPTPPAPAPFVGSFEGGTRFVPRTGLAMLHQGERVTPASENNQSGGDKIEINVNFPHGTDRKTVDYAVSEIERRMSMRRRGMS